MSRSSLVAGTIAAALGAPAAAVTLDAGGRGQALIYPYYTARESRGDAFNTYLSIVNATASAKALRVRFREGRMGAEALSFNLYLSPNDVWTGAVVPAGDGARLVTADTSCTDPAFTPQGTTAHLDFGNARFSADGAGPGLDRTREGFVEVLEMAVLEGPSRTAATHTSAGSPSNCALLRSGGAPSVSRPIGGLSGTLTLINVASGLDFTLPAEALADLSTQPFFRAPADPYPDFSAAEIAPVSVVVANGQAYRSEWSRPVDAVSAALMRETWAGEYVLDAGSASLTDFVFTLPTRHLHATSSGLTPPFSGPHAFGNCQERPVDALYFNRSERGVRTQATSFPGLPSPDYPPLCASTAVLSMQNTSAHVPTTSNVSTVLGSSNLGLGTAAARLPATFENGWARFQADPSAALTSLATSTRVELRTGERSTGPHTHVGLPLVGFSVRTFANGTLSCGGAACQGNYGGAFGLKYQRRITPP